MFCQKCGTQLAESVRFCPTCGSAQAAPVPFPDKVRATAKKVGASPAFLIAAIAMSLALILSLASQLTDTTFVYELLLSELGSYTEDLLTGLNGISLVLGIIGMLPTILIVIGLWITFGTCASRKPKANTAGLTMIFVVTLIQLVLACLALLAVLILSILLYTQATDPYSQAMLLTMVFVAVAALAFVLIYSIKLCTTITNVRSTLQNGDLNKRVSRFVGVLCYISGVFTIISSIGILLGSFVVDNLDPASSTFVLSSYISGISGLLTGVARILFGALIFSYRSKMKALEAEERMNNFKELAYAEPYTSPVYIPPQTETE